MSRCRVASLRLLLAILFVGAIPGAPLPGGEFHKGRLVLQKSADFSILHGGRECAPRGIILVYRIKEIERDRLRVTAMGLEGWVPKSSVVLEREAEAAFSNSIKLRPSDAFAYLMRAIARSSKNPRDQRALTDCDEAIRLEPGIARAYLVRGGLRIERVPPPPPPAADDGKFANASLEAGLRDFLEAVRLEPRNPFARIYRGVCQHRKGDRSQAQADFDEAFRLDRNTTALLLVRATAWDVLGNSELALLDRDAAIGLNPDLAEAHLDKARSLFEKQELQGALAEFDAALKLEPDQATFYLERANCWQALNETDKALADLDDAIRLDASEPDCHRARSGFWRSRGNLDKAIDDWTVAMRLAPGISDDFSERGMLWSMKQDYGKAIEDLNEAIRLDSRNAMAFFYRGLVWLRNRPPGLSPGPKDLEKSLADFSESIRLDPRNPAALDERGQVYLVHVHDFDKAIADFSALIALRPNDSIGYSRRGDAWLAKRALRQALADHDVAFQLDPENPALLPCYMSRAWIRATCPEPALRDGPKAVAAATHACRMTDWKHPGCLEILAASYAEDGDFESAVKWQQQAIDLIPAKEKFIASAREALEKYKEKKPRRDVP